MMQKTILLGMVLILASCAGVTHSNRVSDYQRIISYCNEQNIRICQDYYDDAYD